MSMMRMISRQAEGLRELANLLRYTNEERKENGYPNSAKTVEAFNMAIEALQREEAEAKGYCHRIKPKGGDDE